MEPQQDDESAYEDQGMPFPPYGPPPQQWDPGMPFPPYGPPRWHSRLVQNLFIALGVLIGVIVIVAVSVLVHRAQGSRTATRTGTQIAQVGSAITLAGLAAGEQMSVTVTKVYVDAQPIDQFNEAPAGDRLYVVAFQLKNTGSAGYSDAPGNSALVFDSAGRSYKTQFDNVTECRSFRAVVDIAVGSSSVGCIVYEVPNDVKITQVRVILDSGYGPQTGEWEIGKPEQ
jgi:Domain of unknown function (DUF4352)